jgi:GNAT superfamily N-acetyltransferase
MITVVQYGPRFEKAHYEFASLHWQKRKRTSAEYIYWKFRGKPGEELRSFLLAVDGERVIGQLGLIPCTLAIGDRNVEAQWACELMVDNAYRGKGVAKLLYDFAFDLKPVTLGSDPSAAASVSMKRAGFVSVKGPVKFLFPMYLGEIAKLKGINIPLLNKIPNPFIFFLRAWGLINGKKSFRRILAADYFECLKKNRNGHDRWIRVDHDNGFADWRFGAFKDYYNGVESYSNDSGALFSVYRHPNTYILTEYSAPRLFSLIGILSAAVTEAHAGKARQIKMLADTSAGIRLLSCLGLVRFRTRTEIIFYCADPELKELLAVRPFYYTYLDSDENI